MLQHRPTRRAAALVIAAATFLATGVASATAGVTSSRLQGADRYGTAEAIATGTYGDITVAVIATGENYPDALAAAYLTGANQGPILLNPTATLRQDVVDTLTAMKAEGVQVVGGTAAINDSVVAQLKSKGFAVERIAGADRYGTAKAIAKTLPAAGIGELGTGGRTAIVASGENFPDALAGGPIAHAAGFPILLTRQASLPAETSQAISDLGIKQVLLLGGTAAVSATVESQLLAAGVTVRRIFGVDRQGTAAAIADLAVNELKWTGTHVNLARGDAFPDALAGGPHGGQEKAPILLTVSPTTLGTGAQGWLSAHQSTVSGIHVYGGTAAVSDATVTAARQAAGGA